MSEPALMRAAESGLLIVDVQDKLIGLIPGRDRLILNCGFLVDVARLVHVPVQATEQYPRGLGGTVEELASRLPERPDKVDFSCCVVPGLVDRFRRNSRRSILVAGIETHVCVMQTVLDLLADGFRVYVAADATASRYSIDHETALRRMERSGAILTTVETAAFEWLQRAGTPQFKQVSQLIQDRMKRLADLPTA